MMNETQSINGVPGKMVRTQYTQKWTSELRPADSFEPGSRMRVEIRFDDQCKNGHNTFAITGDVFLGRQMIAGGCLHDEIETIFPELAHLTKWHLMRTLGPTHYIANTLYLAGNRDHWGNENEKERELDAARRSAVWSNATDAELSTDEATLELKLKERLPKLIADFRQDIEAAGFDWNHGEIK